MYQKSNAHLSKSDNPYSPLGIFAVLRYSFMAFTKSWGLLKYCFTKSYDFTSCIRRFVLQNSLGFFPERLNWSYAPSAWIISISISGAVMTFTTSIFCSYACRFLFQPVQAWYHKVKRDTHSICRFFRRQSLRNKARNDGIQFFRRLDDMSVSVIKANDPLSPRVFVKFVNIRDRKG